MANFPLTNFHDLNERTWNEVIQTISEAQPATLSTPITIGETECKTVEEALTAIATALAG